MRGFADVVPPSISAPVRMYAYTTSWELAMNRRERDGFLMAPAQLIGPAYPSRLVVPALAHQNAQHWHCDAMPCQHLHHEREGCHACAFNASLSKPCNHALTASCVWPDANTLAASLRSSAAVCFIAGRVRSKAMRPHKALSSGGMITFFGYA